VGDKNAESKDEIVRIEIVGPGCASCRQLHEVVKKLAPELGLKNEVVYLSDQEGMQRMMQLGMMQAPILLVDGKVAMVGYHPSAQKIKNAIIETAAR
jgi:small redox-active disulfide protein 2